MQLYNNQIIKVFIVIGLIISLCPVGTTKAQIPISVINSELEGFVTDSALHQPLEGVSINIKGTTNQTLTDEKGHFKLQTGQKFPYIIRISLVGYKTLEIEATRPSIQIHLEPAESNLSDVVVVGYGTQKRKDLTGSIASVPISALQQPVSSFERLLQGSVAGVQVTQSNGQPGSTVSIRIRGSNSITGGNEPLYVIDGFPVYNDNSAASSGVLSGSNINALSSLNPSDIESIDILKDASATAIYGARGANGVVIITTRKGKAGHSVVNYNGSVGGQSIIKTIPVLTSAKDWALLKNDARLNAGKTAYYTQTQIDNLGQGTDWQNAALRTASFQNHQLSIYGGDEKTKYAISGNYFNQDGILLNTGFKRYSGRINLDRIVTAKFKVGTNLSFSKIKANVAPGNIVPALLLMPPTVSIYDSLGNYTYQSPFETPMGNPIATLQQEVNNTNTYRLLGNIYGEYKLLKGLVARVSFGADILSNKQNQYIPSSLYKGANATALSVANVGTLLSSSWLNENTVSYSTILNNVHKLDILAGYTQQAYRSETIDASAQGFVTDLLTYNNIGSATTYNQPGSSSSTWALNSYIGRINYAYDNRYFVTVTGRADGSSRFGANQKWGYFPSAALAWNIKNEKSIHLPELVSDLKLRASAGLTGNQEIGQYQSLATLSSNNYFFGGQTVVGFSPNRIGNPDLRWEKTIQYDGGVNIGLWEGRISIDIDAYYKKTNDLLVNVPLPYTTGQSTALQNYGSISNKGIEIGIGADVFREKHFSWHSSLTLSSNKNKVISLGDGVGYIISDPSIAQVGQPIGSFYGLLTNGIFQNSDNISGLPVYLTKNKPGDQRYVDINNDSVITLTGDRVILGNAQPKFIGGLINDITVYNFDLNILIQGSYGNKIFNQNRQQLETLSGQQNASITALDRWTPSNPSNVIPRAYEDPAAVTSSRYVEDGSYLRLKNLTIGYNLPLSISSKLKISQCRIYFTAQNIITWTKYTGFDPEVSKNGQTALTQGIDYALYPSSKSFLGGISINF